MSDAANRERAIKRHWAEPGSRHDAIVKATKYGLPLAIAGLVALLVIAPFDKRDEVSFILDKNRVDKAPERMRVESARYSGEDNKGQKFLVAADRAVQPTSTIPLVSIEGIRASLGLARGPLDIIAMKGRYDLEQEQVQVDGPVRISGPDGYRLQTRDVTIDLDRHTMQSTGAVNGTMELGEFSAGSLRADLDARTVSLNGGVRLKIRQGTVR